MGSVVYQGIIDVDAVLSGTPLPHVSAVVVNNHFGGGRTAGRSKTYGHIRHVNDGPPRGWSTNHNRGRRRICALRPRGSSGESSNAERTKSDVCKGEFSQV